MFILESNVVKSGMFSKGHKVDADIELWHKRISHINLQKLKGMQSKGVVIGLLRFKDKGIEGICDACQFDKQHHMCFNISFNEDFFL